MPTPRWPGDTRPPFEPGNEMSLVHGASRAHLSRRAITEAQELHGRLVEAYPFVEQYDVAQVERYCREETRARLLHEYVMGVSTGEIEAKRVKKGAPTTGIEAVPPYLWAEASRANVNAAKLAQDLGLDPTGRWKLLKDAGWARHLAGDAVGSLRATGRELRARRLGA